MKGRKGRTLSQDQRPEEKERKQERPFDYQASSGPGHQQAKSTDKGHKGKGGGIPSGGKKEGKVRPPSTGKQQTAILDLDLRLAQKKNLPKRIRRKMPTRRGRENRPCQRKVTKGRAHRGKQEHDQWRSKIEREAVSAGVRVCLTEGR